MATIQWTEAGKKQIAALKKSIIKKKIMLGFMIDDYAWWDRIFRYCHAGIAGCIPIISFIDKLASGDTERTSTTTLVLSSIVVGMIKLKDTLKFGKIVALAQQQTVKYKQLYQRIDKEMIKHDSKRQTEDDFIYWVGREYSNIEMADPELTHNMRKKFAALCKEKGIPFDEDMEALADILQEEAKELVEVVVDKVADKVVTDAEEEAEEKKLDKQPADQADVAEKADQTEVVEVTKQAEVDKQVDAVEVPKQVNATNATPSAPALPAIRLSTIPRIRSPSDETDRAAYKETMKTFNPTEDMQWALDRLKDVEE
jgi:hypothetical protein